MATAIGKGGTWFARKYSRETFEGRSKKAERHGTEVRITRYEWSA